MKTIKGVSKFIVSIFLLAINSQTFGQLAGVYTIGGTNPDYTSLGSAVNALVTSGVSGSVVFNIRAGTYSGFSMFHTPIPNLVYPDSVIFQSETHDSTSVIITGSTSTLKFTDVNALTFKWLTVEATGTSPNAAFDIYWATHFNIQNCIISAPNSTGNSSDESSVIIQLNTSTLPTVSIVNSFFTGTSSAVWIEGGGIKMLQNRVMITGRYSISSYSATHLFIDGNILNGDLNVQGSGDLFRNNIVTGVIDRGSFTLIQNNVFNSTSIIQIDGVLFKQNVFNNRYELLYHGGVSFYNNTFNGQIDLDYSDNVKFYNNKATELSTGFSSGIQIVNNEFSGNLFLADPVGDIIRNNVFHGEVELAHGSSNKIYCNLFYKRLAISISQYNQVHFNNFSDSGYVYSLYGDSIHAMYNNFSKRPLVWGSYSHNNYYISGGENDLHPYHYNPNYISAANIRAQNPLLIGKALPVSYVTRDVDSVIRGNPPTIGANEICMPLLSGFDSTVITCGDGVNLKLCSLDTLSNYSWSPSIGLSDSLSLSPIANPKTSTRYYLLDSLGNAIDSAFVIVNDFVHQSIPDDSIRCYQRSLLSGNYNPVGIYSWSPALGLSDSAIYNPWAAPPTTTTYIQQTSVPGCATFLDTVTVVVNPLPIAQVTVSQQGTYTLFYNYSLCGDSFLWNFGDGQTSTLPGDTAAIVHQYATTGVYSGSLIVCNSYGCDTFFFNVNAIGTGIHDLGKIESQLAIYPNPVSDILQITSTSKELIIETELMDITGRKVLGEKVNAFSNYLSVSHLPSGVYLLRALSQRGWMTARVIKN